jgi:hypothetical protein
MRGVLVLALCALALCVAGCGGGGDGRLSKADYKVALGKIVKELNAAKQTVQHTELGATTVADAVAGLREFAAREDSLGDEVEKINPPSDAEKAHDKLAETMHDDAKTIRKVLPKLSSFSTVSQMIGYLKSQPQPESAREQEETLSNLGALGYLSGY